MIRDKNPVTMVLMSNNNGVCLRAKFATHTRASNLRWRSLPRRRVRVYMCACANYVAAVIQKASNRALGGGLAGGAAMAINVCTLMWMRTTVNFQYRYGMGTFEAFRHLYKEGGIPRFYRGLIPALAQAPISRFGDTAANAGMLALWDEIEATKDLPVFAKTLSASLAAASFRYFLMPIDACKTIMQVEGKGGFSALVNKVRVGGPGVLWAGGAGAVMATFVGHYPWYELSLSVHRCSMTTTLHKYECF